MSVAIAVACVAVLVIGGSAAFLLVGSGPRNASSMGQTTTTTSPETTNRTISSSQTRSSATSVAVQFPNSTAYTSNSSIGLQLGLFLSADSAGGLTVSVSELNVRNDTNNLTAANDWRYSPDSLNPYSPCNISVAFGPLTPFGFAILRGYYGSNVSDLPALPLYNASMDYTCAQYTETSGQPAPYYSFQPASINGTFVFGGMNHNFTSLTFSANGYWAGGESSLPASFERFPLGNYTVIAADEWGQLVVLHFGVVPSGGPYTVTFRQSGVCSPPEFYAPWSVTLGNVTHSQPSNGSASPGGILSAANGNLSVISFSVAPGTYRYEISPSAAFAQSSGTVTVSNANAAVSVVPSPPPLCNSTPTSSATTTCQVSASSNESQSPVQILSVKLVNTSIGSHVVFDVTFENIGNQTIYYASYDGRTSPVSASIGPCSPSVSPISQSSTATDCMRTISAVPLAPGDTASAQTTDCMDSYNYNISSSGMIQAVITLYWSNGSSPYGLSSESASVIETFAVG